MIFIRSFFLIRVKVFFTRQSLCCGNDSSVCIVRYIISSNVNENLKEYYQNCSTAGIGVFYFHFLVEIEDFGSDIVFFNLFLSQVQTFLMTRESWTFSYVVLDVFIQRRIILTKNKLNISCSWFVFCQSFRFFLIKNRIRESNDVGKFLLLMGSFLWIVKRWYDEPKQRLLYMCMWYANIYMVGNDAQH